MDMFLIFNPFQISPKSILYTLWGLRGYNAGHRSEEYFKGVLGSLKDSFLADFDDSGHFRPICHLKKTLIFCFCGKKSQNYNFHDLISLK